jgi:hypothetical protein
MQFWFAPNIDTWGGAGSAISQIFFTNATNNTFNIVKTANASKVSFQLTANATVTTLESFAVNTANGAWNYVAISWTPAELNLQVNNAALQTTALSNAFTNPFGTMYFGGLFGNGGNINFDNFRITNTAPSSSEMLAGYSATTEFSAIPEPKSLPLLLLGGLGILLTLHRNRCRI